MELSRKPIFVKIEPKLEAQECSEVSVLELLLFKGFHLKFTFEAAP